LLKIAPDLTNEQLHITDNVADTKIAGVIATNTTISREGLQSVNKKWRRAFRKTIDEALYRGD
jgi:dihydroorotate dehydrogenase